MTDILQQAIDKYQPTHVIGMFSGGHDSLVATHIAAQHPRFSFAAHMNTGIGIEQTRNFVRDTCREWGIELREYRADEYVRADGQPDPQVYEEMVAEYGFPGPPMHKKMYARLKERPLRHMLRDLGTPRGARIILVTGIRADESTRRMAHTKAIQEWEAKVWVAPIWDWAKRDVYEYIKERDLKRSWVADILHMSGECLCGAFAHEGELEEIRQWFPERAAEIDHIQERVMQRFPWGWEDRPPEWWMPHENGQEFIPGLEPEILCTGCVMRQKEEPHGHHQT